MPLLNPDQIKEMWSARAATVANGDSVTHWDVHQRKLEIAELLRHLRPDDVVLDMGCGNGWSTVQLSSHCRQITGMDYSEEMIARARAEQRDHGAIKWFVANVLDLEGAPQYDVVITIRCLINIIDPELQRKAISNLHGVLKPGGRLLMMEGIADGRAELNRARTNVGLATMPDVVHNVDFKTDETLAFLKTTFKTVELHSNGTFDFITRLLYPLLIRPAEPTYGSPFHEAALTIAQSVVGLEQLSRFGLFKCVK